MKDQSYNHICEAADTCKNPSVTVTPIMCFTSFDKGVMRGSVQLQIDARGMDGSYTRAFTQRTIMEKMV